MAVEHNHSSVETFSESELSQDLKIKKAKLITLRLVAVMAISLAALGAQLIGSWLTASIVLLADTVHLFADTVGLAIATVASFIVLNRLRRGASQKSAVKIEAISAIIQATLLIAVGFFALLRGVRGLRDGHFVTSDLLTIFAIIGLLANIVCAIIIYSDRKENLNLQAAFLEVVSDGLSSIVVLIVALTYRSGFTWGETFGSIVIGLIIIPRAILLLYRGLRAFGFTKFKRSIAFSLILILGLLGTHGLSRGYQHFFPSYLDTIPPYVDRYEWSGGPGYEDIRLDLEAEDLFNKDNLSGVATLSDGCNTAESNYSLMQGGIMFEGFESSDLKCTNHFDEIFEANSGYLNEDLRGLRLYDSDFNELIVLYSPKIAEERDVADFWYPFWDILFRI